MSQPIRNMSINRSDDSDDFQPSPEWVAEINRRVEQIDSGDAVLIDADTAFAEIRADLTRIRHQ